MILLVFISLSDAAIQFFLNVNDQLYKFDEKLDDLGKHSNVSRLVEKPQQS